MYASGPRQRFYDEDCTAPSNSQLKKILLHKKYMEQFNMVLLFRLEDHMPHRGPILSYAKQNFKRKSDDLFSRSISSDFIASLHNFICIALACALSKQNRPTQEGQSQLGEAHPKRAVSFSYRSWLFTS